MSRGRALAVAGKAARAGVRPTVDVSDVGRRVIYFDRRIARPGVELEAHACDHAAAVLAETPAFQDGPAGGLGRAGLGARVVEEAEHFAGLEQPAGIAAGFLLAVAGECRRSGRV